MVKMQELKELEKPLVYRLKQVIKTHYGNQKEFAKEFNLSPSTISDWWSGRINPRTDILQQICEKTGISMDWLVLGRESSNYNITIPNYTQPVSAGKGILGEDNTKLPLKINKEWLEEQLYKKNFNKLFAITAQGESMEPEIKSGDTLIVEETKILSEGIYIISYMGDIFVKKLQKISNTKLRIISLNKIYKPIDINLENLSIGDFNIIGKVIFNLRKYII